MKPFCQCTQWRVTLVRLKASIKKVPIWLESAQNPQRLMISGQDFFYFLHMYILLVCFGYSLRLIFAGRLFFPLFALSLSCCWIFAQRIDNGHWKINSNRNWAGSIRPMWYRTLISQFGSFQRSFLSIESNRFTNTFVLWFWSGTTTKCLITFS